MLSKNKVKIKNKTGLHARPAAQFVQKASNFDSEINIIYDGQEVNAKSIMGVMSLGIGQGSEILLKAEGDDSETALEELSRYIEVKMPEEDN
ncbi:MAG: HPr family phosphocarrier protein [Halanaerobium sp.]